MPSRADQVLEAANVGWGRLGVGREAGDAGDVEAVAAAEVAERVVADHERSWTRQCASPVR